jgi:hypothetical protein
MRNLIICAAGALALAACQGPADNESAEAPAAADAAMDTSSADAGRTTAPSGSAPTADTGAADAAAGAPVDTMGAPPAGEGTTSGLTPEVRDNAKQRAEETNLHPRT